MRPTTTLIVIGFLLASTAGAQPTQSKEIFRWKGTPDGAKVLHLRNVNGSIEVRTGTGPEIEVAAKAVWRGSANPDRVAVARKAAGGHLTFCVMIKDQAGGLCEADGRYGSDHGGVHDLTIALTVVVPTGLNVDASTVNGNIKAQHRTGALTLETTNGAIDANTQGGPTVLRSNNGSMRVSVDKADLDARTENGAIDVTLGAAVTRARLQTTNGTVSVARPRRVGAELTAETDNGRIVVDGRPGGKAFRGRLGAAGGPRIEAITVNGSVDVVAR